MCVSISLYVCLKKLTSPLGSISIFNYCNNRDRQPHDMIIDIERFLVIIVTIFV